MDYSEASARSIGGYLGSLGAGAAERILLSKGEPGYYLLRKVERLRHVEYVISYLKVKNEVRHFIIPNQRRHNLFSKNPQITSLETVFAFIIEKSKNSESLLFQIDGEEVIDDDDDGDEDEQVLEAFPCHVCPENFDNNRQLQNHLNGHKIHYCDLCDQVISKNSVTSHAPSCSGNAGTFQCSQCSFNSKHQYSYDRHLQEHQEGKRSHICQDCKSSFKTQRLLEAHLFKKHSKGVLCDICDKNFESTSKRDAHVKNVHVQRKVHQCPECDKQFRFPSKLRKHLESHQNAKAPPDPPPLHSCPDCSYKSRKKGNLNRHVRNTHGPRKPNVIKSLKLFEIISRRLMSLKNGIELARAIRKIIGKHHFEANLEDALRECLHAFEEEYESEVVYWRDSKNKQIKSTLVWIKDLETIIAKIIEEKKMTNPRIIFRYQDCWNFSFTILKISFYSFDGGNGKLIVCLSVVDMDNPSDSGSMFKSNGRRQQLVVARGDFAPENMFNWSVILSKLGIFDENHFWREFYVSGDLKVMNAFSGCII